MTTRLLLLAALISGLPQLAHAQESKPVEAAFALVTGDDGKATKVPLFGPEAASVTAARIGEETITVQDVARALTLAHESMGAGGKAGKKDFAPVLERMIEVRLLVQEARAMGIADLPEIQADVAGYRETALQDLLKHEVTKDAKPDPAAVEAKYRDAVREWKIKSALFPRLEDAAALKSAMAKGKSFDELVKKAVAEKKAKGGENAEFLPRNRLLPEVMAALAPMKKGDVSAPVKLPDGYALVRVEDIRYPDDPKAKAEAEAEALQASQVKALKKYYGQLVKERVKIDEKLLKSVDYHAKKPGLKALEKDQRVLARFTGGPKPITVSELTAAMREQFHHGLENAIKEKKANRLKGTTLDVLISRRVIPLVAVEKGIDKTPAYNKAIEEYSNSIIFAQFVDKAVMPSIKITDDDLKKYYDQHKAEFTLPGFYKLEALGFSSVKDAQAAVNKLRSGTDLKWLRQNADNQLKDEVAELKLGGTTVSANALPADLQSQLTGAKKGDFRLYTTASGQSYAISVLDVTPPEVEPMDQVRDGIGKRLYSERAVTAIKDWAAKVRQARPVKVYLTKIGNT